MEVYRISSTRWGYKVESIVQEWHPDFEGFVPMDRQEALVCAQAMVDRLAAQNATTEPEVPVFT